MEPSETEKTDFALLRATREVEAGNHPEACRIYADVREEKFDDPGAAKQVDFALISLAAKLEPDERKEFEKPLRAALLTHKPQFNHPQQRGAYESPFLKFVEEFGFDDLVELFTPSPPAPAVPRNGPVAIQTPLAPAPARIQVPSVSSGSRGGGRRSAPVDPIERFQDFAREGKATAAGRELLQQLRKNIRSGSDSSYTVRNLQEKITPEIRAEIISLAAPGDVPGLTRRREFIEICLALGEEKEALAALEALAAERPFDPTVTSALAFLLPATERDRAVALLTKAAESRGLAAGLNEGWEKLSSKGENEAGFEFLELFTAFLEISAPAIIHQADVAQISNFTQQVFRGNGFRDIPSVHSPPPAQKEGEDENPAIAKHAALARKLALAMLRHPALAENAFRLLHAANWQEKPEDLDRWAREALLASAAMKDRNHRYSYGSNGLSEKSSAIYLVGRLAGSPAPTDLFPAAYLAGLGELEPVLRTLVEFLNKSVKPEEIEPLWESGAVGRQNDPILSVFQKAATDHVTVAPGANGYFLSRLRAFTPEERKAAKQANFHKEMPLLVATLATCARQDGEGVAKTCKALFDFILAEDPEEKSSPGNNQSTYALQQLFQGFLTDPLTCVRIVRAMDGGSVPFNDSNWIQSCFQELRNLNPEETVELFASLGFLNKAGSWEPLAIHALTTDYDRVTRQQTISVRRTEQLTRIFQNVSTSSDDRKIIIGLLESRTPRTFGSLLSAAILSSGAERGRLATAAYEVAAPDLAKLPAGRVDDFALYLDYLPRSATASLPPPLRAKADTLHQEKIALLVETIEKQFEQSRQSSGSNLFGYIDESVIQLAAYDVKKPPPFSWRRRNCISKREHACREATARTNTLSAIF